MNEPPGLYAPSLVEVTTRQLREEILSGELAPGERLIEEQIRLRFSISRAPLREALRSLAQQGLVEHLPRRGTRVTDLTDDRHRPAVRHPAGAGAARDRVRRSRWRSPPDEARLAEVRPLARPDAPGRCR